MKHYKATTTINAAPAMVWDILIDGASYPEWDPNMLRVEGALKLGEKVSFFTKLSPERAFPAKVTLVDAPNKMVLTGGMPLGLFKSERTHTLTATADGGTQFTTEEVFSGLLLPLFGKQIPDLNPIFEQFSAGLKQRAEES